MGYSFLLLQNKPNSSYSDSHNNVRSRKRREILKRILFILLALIFIIFILDYLSSDKLRELKIQDGFGYPVNVTNFPEVVREFRNSKSKLRKQLKLEPINLRYSSIPFLENGITDLNKDNPHGLLIIVKSAVQNVEKRDGIRKTWGNSLYLQESQMSNLPTKLLFICGVPNNSKIWSQDDFEHLFPTEWHHNDMILADFIDKYENNTYKSVIALRWAAEEFPALFKHLFLVDDDMFVDIVNLVAYLDNFASFNFLKQDELSGPKIPFYRRTTIYNKNIVATSGTEILKTGFYMGQVYWNASPLRPSLLSFHRPEWLTTREEYGYNFYPPYTPGAAIILSREAVIKFYYASFFVKHFKIDDVYFGILANKLGIIPVHNHNFHADYPKNKKLDIDRDIFSEAIAVHGAQCSRQMTHLWFNRDPQNLINCD